MMINLENNTKSYEMIFLRYHKEKLTLGVVLINFKKNKNTIVQDTSNCGIYAVFNGINMFLEGSNSKEKINRKHLKKSIFNLVKENNFYLKDGGRGTTMIGEFFDGVNLCNFINSVEMDNFIQHNIGNQTRVKASITELNESILKPNDCNEIYLIPIYLETQNNLHWIAVYNEEVSDSSKNKYQWKKFKKGSEIIRINNLLEGKCYNWKRYKCKFNNKKYYQLYNESQKKISETNLSDSTDEYFCNVFKKCIVVRINEDSNKGLMVV